MQNDIQPLELPVEKLSVPVMIALLARIQDQLTADEATSDLGEVLALVITTLLEMREEAFKVMTEADKKRRHDYPGQTAATPASMC